MEFETISFGLIKILANSTH